jgi:hypothetical protein
MKKPQPTFERGALHIPADWKGKIIVGTMRVDGAFSTAGTTLKRAMARIEQAVFTEEETLP